MTSASALAVNHGPTSHVVVILSLCPSLSCRNVATLARTLYELLTLYELWVAPYSPSWMDVKDLPLHIDGREAQNDTG